MLISHEHQFIFIKTRKTAGSSIENYLQPYSQEGPKIPQWKDKHVPASVIKDLVGPEKWSIYTKIIAFRNPWDQVVSLYHWRRRKRPFGSLAMKLLKGKQVINSAAKLGFQEWVQYKNLDLNENREIIYPEGDMPDYHVIYFENLEQNLKEICNQIGIPFEASRIPMLKGGLRPKKPYQAYYDDKSREIVRQAFSREIEDFGYTF